ncbi:MAG: FAD-binding oxidoreductase [Nevskia sp.]|nr:FAD-binding oxidoreductase [Nevskia sp.]
MSAHTLRGRFGTHCFDDPQRLLRYEIPERGAAGKALAVLVPESEDEVGAVLRACNELQQPLVISAGRTGLVEAQRPQGEAVLSLEKLKRPLAFVLSDGRSLQFDEAGDVERWRDQLLAWWLSLQASTAQQAGAPVGATITVQAGIAVDALNDVLACLGLVWPMEMGSSSAASAGGCVANASAGANAVCYGTAAHLCVAAWGFWGDGAAAGPSAAPAWDRPGPETLAIDSASVQTDWGLVGSQGVLGVITRVQLRTYPLPAQREAVLLPVADMPAAMKVFEAARQRFPGDVEEFEFIGRAAIELVREHLGAAFRWPFESEPAAPYFVLLQLKTQDADADLASQLYDFVADELQWPSEQIGYAPLPALKKLRHSITEASNARMRKLGGGRLSFDTATPVNVFGDYLATLQRELIAQWPQLEFVAFGHAGVGGAHLHLLGTREQPVTAQAAAVVARVFDITAEFGGTFSAEHGVGSKWAREFQQRAPEPVRTRLSAAKRQYDPRHILNPASFGLT